MRKINSAEYVVDKLAELSLLRKQDGFCAFKESPSDKYDPLFENEDPDKAGRMSAMQLFSLFTADIINKKVVFIR